MDITRPESHQPIPADARRVFKGKIFDVYQWDQKLFDGSIGVFEKMRRSDTVVVFPVLPNGKILLTKQQQPGTPLFIAGAGGRMEEGEDPVTAAKREMLEETGYDAAHLQLWRASQPVGKIDWAVYVFIAKGIHKVSELNLDAGEKIELMEVTFDKFLSIARQENFAEKEIVPDILEALLDKEKGDAVRKLFSPDI